jgi:hypothetical protein|nr:MAG TPA: hypothetical protein [Caudoviricetes sp.]
MFQPTYPDFASLNILFKEKCILFSLRFKKCRKGDVFSSKLNKLREYGLISENYLPQRDSEGNYLSAGTYSLSDRGRRYFVYLRKQRFYRYLTPIIVAFLTSIATNLLKELWLPALLNWLQGQP